MRSDMYKVIVERPRKWKDPEKGVVRRRNDFDGPRFLGMRAGHGRPALNENLNPLKRYLRAQVGRPWNKVYGEISAGIDRRNVVQQHIFEHLDDYIALQVEWRDGSLVDLRSPAPSFRTGRCEPVQELYVDPRTGLIRPNKSYRSYIRDWRAGQTAQAAALALRLRRIDAGTLLLRIDGEWYEVRTAALPVVREISELRNGKVHLRHEGTTVFDVVLKYKLHPMQHRMIDEREKLYGGDLYAVSKRQLSRREIADHGLPR
jgi:hypothetical protein